MTKPINFTDMNNDLLLQTLVDIAEDDRVSIRAAYLPDPDKPLPEEETPWLTHQVLVLTVGDIVAVSEPAAITRPFKAIFTDEELIVPAGETIQ